MPASILYFSLTVALVATALGTGTLQRGNVCTDRPNDCAAGLACDGRDAEKRCIEYKQAGMECRLAEPFWICQPGLTCEDSVCRIPQNGVCTNNRDDCVDGTDCDGRAATKRCIVYKQAGMECRLNENHWICQPGLSCEDSVCRIPEDAVCTENRDACVDGTVCEGNNAERRCVVPQPQQAGEECGPNDPSLVCDSGLTCEDSVCKIPQNGVCTNNRDACVDGTDCDGRAATKRCIVYKQAGMECRLNENHWICQPGLTCEDSVCRIPEDGVCTDNRDACVDGTVCEGNNAERRCVVPQPQQAGEECGPNDPSLVCDSGLTCEDSVCKIPQNGVCTNNRDACVDGTDCDGRAATKRCIVYKQAGMECRLNENHWICQPGLTCEDSVCRIPEDAVCTDNRDACVDGTVCEGNNAERRCVVPQPQQAGEECGPNDPSLVCDSGLTCEDSVCKIPQNGVCTNNRDACVDGTDCDGRAATKRCIVYKQAGMECRLNENHWICQPGLTCEDSVCTIPVGGSCVDAPNACVEGASCTDSVCTPEPREVDETCDNTFKCKTGLVCDGSCKLPEKADCTKHNTSCVAGTICAGVRQRMLCSKTRPEGARCSMVGYLPCKADLNCVDNVCVRGNAAPEEEW